MNQPPKLVFASPGSLESTPRGSYDNAHLVDANVAQTVRELKQEDGAEHA